MTTAEKLVSLFQRKKSIIEHVKQRIESYNQHLASKFLVEEIDPPSWFRDPSALGSTELKEEELISKLLRQYPQSSVPWSVARYPGHSNSVTTGDHEKFVDGDFIENLVPNKNLDQNNDHGDDAGCSGEDHAESLLNTVPELDASVASPEAQIDERISNIYTAPDQSLARIQRSKSRQKALELCSSAKAPAKSGLRHESSSDVVSGQIRFSPSITNQSGQNTELSTLGEPCIISSQSCENRNVDEARHLTREMGVDAHSKGIIRSETYAEVTISAVGSVPLGCSSEDCKENTSSLDGRVRREESMPISDTEHADNHVNKSPKSAGPYGDRWEENATFVCKDEEKNVYTGEITISEVSSRRQSCGCDSTKADKFSDDYQSINITMMDSGDDLHPDCVDGSLMKINLSNVHQEGCDARESVLEDSGRYKERDVFPSLSSIQCNACIDEISDLEIPSASAKVYGGILAPSSAESAKEVNDSQELSGLVKLSDGLFHRVTRSETHSYGKEPSQPITYDENPSFEGTKSFSDREEKSAEELQNPSGQSVPPCLGTHKMLHDDENGKLVMASELDEGFETQESVLEDSGRCKERDVFPSLSSIQCNAGIPEIFDLEVPSASAQICEGIPTPSSAGPAKQVNDSLELSGLVKPSDGLFRSVTRSETRSCGKETYQSVTHDENPSFEGTKSFSDFEEKSAEELQKSSDQSVPSCLGTHKMLHDDKNGKHGMASELCLLDSVDKSCLSSSKYSKQSRGLKSEVALTPSDSFVSMEHKQLMLPETEEYSVKAFTSRSGEKMSCSFDDPDVSLDKGTCGGINQPSSSRQSPGMSDISSKGERVYRDSLEPDVQESPYTHVGICGPVIGSAILNAFSYRSEAELNCRSSEVPHETHNVLSKSVDITDIQNPPVKLLVKHGLESSSPVHCMEQGRCNEEARDKDQWVSSVPESKISRSSYGHNSAKDTAGKSYGCSIKKTGTNQSAIDEIKQYTGQHSQISSWSEDEGCSEHEDSSLANKSLRRPSTITLDGKNSSLERRFRHARIESWPQFKRRKTEHQQTHCFATSQSFRVTKAHTFQRDPDVIFPKTMEIDIDTGVVEHVDKSTDDGICSEVNTNLMEGIQSTTLSQLGEAGSCYIKKSDHKFTSPVISNEQLVATISCLAVKESSNSQGCFIEGTRTSPSSCEYVDARMSGDKQFSQNLCYLKSNADNLSSECLKLSCTMHKEINQSLKWEDGLHLQHSVLSSSNEDPQLTDVDQSMPVFERFAVNAQTDPDELDFTADGFDLCNLELPRTTLERASMLAEICRSASLDRPSSYFSSTFKFQETSNLCKSLSEDDGHLDHMELGNNLNADLGIQFQSHCSSSDDYTDTLDGMPYSVSLTYSGERYGWNSRNQPPSPVGKLWNRLSSHMGSSGKCSSSNPELTCFPIEEDPSSSEENRTMEENAGETLDETDSSLGKYCQKSQPLKDLTNMGTNPPMSVSAEEGTFRADAVDILSSKFSVTRTQKKTFLGPKYQFRKRSETSEKQTSCTRAADGRKHLSSYIDSNAIKRAKESGKDSSSKPSVSNKTSLKGQDQKLSLRESRTNNIVSNVASFIPLIQQKQAATAACTGKRDVKVKALETAEAAKRLMEKKANERNQRKEAIKFERAAKNLKHMELENRKKEEERKKKNADIAKKRLREDEEKKEKEKKRLRLEPRQRQREQEEKKLVERHEKENQLTKNEQLNKKKECNNESKRPQNEETTREEGVALQKTDTNLTLSESVMNHEERGTSGLSCDAEVMHAVDKSPRNEDLKVQNNQGKSYDISPYRSDDEDEEDDELPIKKYIPSWASKTSMALLVPLQQALNPDVIFPPDRSCSKDEVLLTRKLQQKQVVHK